MIHSQSRRVGGISPAWFIFSSLFLHFLIVVALLLYRDTRPKGFPIATTVELVSADRLEKTKPTEKPSPPVVPTKPSIRPHVRNEEHHRVKVERHAILPVREKKPKKPVQKKHLVKMKPKITSKRKVAKSPPVSRKKPVHAISKPKAVTSNEVAKANPVRNTNPMPVKMDIQGQAFPTYLEHLLISRIKSNWFPPPGTKGLKATIRFVLKKGGGLEGPPTIESGSGNGLFDDAARMAILRSIPFPPFPPGFKKEKEVVTVTLEATPHGGVFDGP